MAAKESDEILKELKPEHKIFCENYIFDWNGSRAYKVAYPNTKNDDTARAGASRLLTNDNIQAYIELIQKDLSKLAGVSALKNAEEYKKIAFSSLHHYKTDWFTLEEWDNVSEDDKAAISEITNITRTNKLGDITEIVKFKLHDKQKALDALNKMFGFNAPDKMDLSSLGEKLNIPIVSWVKPNQEE